MFEAVIDEAGRRKFTPGVKLTASDLVRDARQSAACGHHLLAHYPVVDTASGEVPRPYVHRGYFCQMPAVCPVCSRRVGDVRQARYAPKMEEALNAGFEPYLVTFTLPACTSIPEQLAALRRALRRFQTAWRLPSNPVKRAAFLKRGGVAGEWQKVVASGLKIEVKRGEGSGEWHVHAHALVFTSAPLDYRVYATREDKAAGVPMRQVEFREKMVAASKISAEWLAATDGAAMGVDVHPLYLDRKTGKRMTREGVVDAAREVMKYVCDLDDRSSPGDWLDVRCGTWGRRLWSVYGGFRGAPGDDYVDERDDLDIVDEVNIVWRGTYTGDYESRGAVRRVSLKGRKEFSLKCLTLRARINGMCRKMRSAIQRARATFQETGSIPECFDVEIVSPLDGERRSMQWPSPNYLTVETALSGEGWERWTNEVTQAARYMAASVESDLSDMTGDDLLGFRLGGDASVSETTWEAWRLALDFKYELTAARQAFAALGDGGIQRSLFAGDFFDPEHAQEFFGRHGYDREAFPPSWFEPAPHDPHRR